jgi:hypothetical protein
MQEFIKYYSAIIGIKLLNTVFSFTDLISYFCGMVYSSSFSILTGLENTWCFYEGSDVPVQQRFTSSTTRQKIEWYYYRRTREWVHRDAVPRKPAKRCPWMITTLVTPCEDTIDLSEFFAGHRFYMPRGYIQWPTAEQMIAAWSIESYQWFIGDSANKTMMTIMDKDCEEHSFYIGLQDEDSMRAYWRTFGMTYSADSSAAPSEASSEGEEDESEESEESEHEENTEEAEEETVQTDEQQEEASEQQQEEASEQPVVETEEQPTSDTEDAVLLPESPVEEEEAEVLVGNRMDEVD